MFYVFYVCCSPCILLCLHDTNKINKRDNSGPPRGVGIVTLFMFYVLAREIIFSMSRVLIFGTSIVQFVLCAVLQPQARSAKLASLASLISLPSLAGIASLA